MKSVLFLPGCALLASLSFGQPGLRQLTPVIGPMPDVSVQAQQQFDKNSSRCVFLLEKLRRGAAEEAELKKLLEHNDPTKESVWDIVGDGCSWYEEGGPYRVIASSALGPNYSSYKVHDLSLQYAWVEGVPGDGIGESVTYYFKNSSPRLNEIEIYNGYVKTPTLWEANNRVKKIKLWMNNQPYALLCLRDSPALQRFKVPLLGHRTDKKDLVLRFEILEIYPGAKYHDTALTEIFFDGIDVH
jgi:hypothetical protein